MKKFLIVLAAMTIPAAPALAQDAGIERWDGVYAGVKAAIQAIYDRWTDEYSAYWAGQIADIKSRVESRAQVRGAKRA